MEIGCRDGCGAKSTNPGNSGWYYLESQQRYRCPQCSRALEQINQPQQAIASEESPK